MTLREKLFPGFDSFVLGEHRRDGFCGYGPPDEFGEFPAVMDMRDLEADNEPEAETGDANERVTDNVDHIFTLPYVSFSSSSTSGTTESASEHSFARVKKRFV